MYRAYVICTSPRSGSTLLCKCLEATGVAGRPRSFFHDPALSSWLDYYNLNADPAMAERDVLAKVFRAAIQKGRGENGVFGLRLQRGSFGFFTEKLAVLHPGMSNDVARFQAAFGKVLFIHLSREDKVDQAISFEKAEQSGLWHMAADGSELERLAPPQAPEYDGEAIRAKVEEFRAFDRQWAAWFAAEAISPLKISYSSLANDPSDALARVLDALGLDRTAAKDIAPPVAKLSDATNRDWKARYLRENPTAM